jgi:MFS family permease
MTVTVAKADPSPPSALRSSITVLYAARGVRGFGDGFAIIILPAYLTAVGYDPVQIGIVATVALLGTALLTLGTGMIAARYDLRTLLIAGAGLMAATGLAFPNAEHFVFVAMVAFVGTINPATGDLGVLVPIEHAMLAHGVSGQERTRTFARYSLIGALSMAAGSLAAAAPDFLVPAGIDNVTAFKWMFYAYAALGVLSALLYRRLPHAQMDAQPSAPLGPSRGMVYKLSALFSLDAFAGGFVVQSLLVLWLFERFNLSLSTASVFFFWASTASAFSYPVAAWLAKHIGLINTMVYTHIPSSLLLIVAAFSPDLYLTLGLLLVRAALSQMDVPTRTSYVMAVVTPPERAAAASFTAVPRSLASAISPAFAGALLASPFPGLPLVICGVLKIAYDVALLISFRHTKPPEEQRPP